MRTLSGSKKKGKSLQAMKYFHSLKHSPKKNSDHKLSGLLFTSQMSGSSSPEGPRVIQMDGTQTAWQPCVQRCLCCWKSGACWDDTQTLPQPEKKQNICDANTASPCVTWLQNVIRVIDETYVCVLQHPTLW